MSWEYEIWQDEKFIDAGDDLNDLERPPGSRTILDASMVGPGEVDAAIAAAQRHGVQGLILSAATDAHGAALGAVETLDSLDLTHSTVTDTLLPSLAGLVRLRSLALRATKVEGIGLEALLELRSLQVLDLTRTPLVPEALRLVGRMASLRELWLDGTPLPGEALGRLSRLTGLERLGLGGIAIAPGELGFLAGLGRLQHLDLQGRGVCADDDSDGDSEGCEEPGAGAGAEEEEDAGPDFGDDDLAVLAGLTALRSLSLAGRRHVEGPGLAALAALSSLEELDLSETQVTARHLAPLAALPLVRLVLRETPLGPAAKGKAGYAALAASKTLSHLDLAGATLDDAAVKLLAGCPALEVLVLEHTPVGPKALAAFASHASLQTVRYDGFRMDRDQAVAFGKAGRPPAGLKRRTPSGVMASILDEEPRSARGGVGAALLGGFEDEDLPAGERFGAVLDVEAEEAEAPAAEDAPAARGKARGGDPTARLAAAIFGKGFGGGGAARGAGAGEGEGEGEGDEEEAGGEAPGDAEVEAEKAARLLLAKLVEAGKVELVEGATLADFPDGLGAILTGRGSGEKKAALVTEWLLDQEDVVEEVYYSDDELGPVLDVW